MSSWQIIPKDSVGPLALGAGLADLKSSLGNDYDSFNRGANPNEILAFDSQGVQVETNAEGHAIAISAFSPLQVSLNGTALLGRELAELENELEIAGFHFERVDAGLWNAELLVMIVEQEGLTDGVEVRQVPY